VKKNREQESSVTFQEIIAEFDIMPVQRPVQRNEERKGSQTHKLEFDYFLCNINCVTENEVHPYINSKSYALHHWIQC
jgi:hypothetical protein